jgi:hypothetical protein
MSPTPDGALANLQQTITDLHRQLAASNAERDQALARESATAEILQVINSTPRCSMKCWRRHFACATRPSACCGPMTTIVSTSPLIAAYRRIWRTPCGAPQEAGWSGCLRRRRKLGPARGPDFDIFWMATLFGALRILRQSRCKAGSDYGRR